MPSDASRLSRWTRSPRLAESRESTRKSDSTHPLTQCSSARVPDTSPRERLARAEGPLRLSSSSGTIVRDSSTPGLRNPDMKDILTQFQKDGYVVLEGFFNDQEVEEMKSSGEEFTTNLPPESERKIFTTVETPQSRDSYFLESALKVSFFFESEALDENGKLKVHPRVSLNKVGHALHWLHPTFKKFTFDERIKETTFQLNLQEPAVCQSMYIYKNPGIGSEVKMHQDSTYVHTEPPNVVGFWIALDDAVQENGCLWIAPGSHQSGVHRRYIRNKDPESKELLIYDKAAPCYPLSNFRPVPVNKGSCIILNGQVVHFSKANRSEKSRHAYTFHVIETKHTAYSKDNWLQPGEHGFPLLYRN
ncbi:phytanoyl-CoA dioxygenase domain-containing protein 1 homolog isoform X2 [Orussus abietinus]|uniref:phytanoyl-CoA dioxygenase domain-containing protein 1 homolog isoform X2 n=1 Tax=Orussus abietinus TaxID=222816 RepID=UPI0006266768|nr:phytanoyl-CoA dioxygenase domain-containing protein 1 homolog isoform X2 [Orussus abietinus]